MQNLMDYLAWRGDLDLDAAPICEVDLAVLAAVVYFPFEEIMGDNITGMTLAELDAAYHDALQKRVVLPFDESLNNLQAPLAASRRFGNVRLRRFVHSTEDNEVDELDKQFCAATFSFPTRAGKETAVVAFRGTDATMVGWRENFTMGYADSVPAQHDALAFLNEELTRFSRVYVCGHSKGGNLAMYSAANAKAQDRVLSVLNLDGPGLSDAVLATPAWAGIKPRVTTLVPQSSIIGMLLGLGEPREVVVADGASIAQHDLFMWHVLGTSFVRAEARTASSEVFDKGIDEYLATNTEEERKHFVYGLFKLLMAGGATTTDELVPSLMKTLPGRLRGSGRKGEELTDEEREELKEFVGCLRRAGAAELGDSIIDKLPAWMTGAKNADEPMDEDAEEADAAVAEALKALNV